MSKHTLLLNTLPGVSLEIDGDNGKWRKAGGSRNASREEVLLGLECLRRGEPIEGTLEEHSDASKICLNAADKAVLVLLPGVGAVTAQAIIDARPVGSFGDLEAVEVELSATAQKLVSF